MSSFSRECMYVCSLRQFAKAQGRKEAEDDSAASAATTPQWTSLKHFKMKAWCQLESILCSRPSLQAVILYCTICDGSAMQPAQTPSGYGALASALNGCSPFRPIHRTFKWKISRDLPASPVEPPFGGPITYSLDSFRKRAQ